MLVLSGREWLRSRSSWRVGIAWSPVRSGVKATGCADIRRGSDCAGFVPVQPLRGRDFCTRPATRAHRVPLEGRLVPVALSVRPHESLVATMLFGQPPHSNSAWAGDCRASEPINLWTVFCVSDGFPESTARRFRGRIPVSTESCPAWKYTSGGLVDLGRAFGGGRSDEAETDVPRGSACSLPCPASNPIGCRARSCCTAVSWTVVVDYFDFVRRQLEMGLDALCRASSPLTWWWTTITTIYTGCPVRLRFTCHNRGMDRVLPW